MYQITIQVVEITVIDVNLQFISFTAKSYKKKN